MIQKETLLALERAGFRKTVNLQLIESYLPKFQVRFGRFRFGWPKLEKDFKLKTPEQRDRWVVCAWALVFWDFMALYVGNEPNRMMLDRQS